MIASVVFALAIVAPAPGFRVRLDAADERRRSEPGRPGAGGVPLALRTFEPDRSRVDLLVLADRQLPRWKWTDAGLVSGGRLTLHAPARSTVLLVLTDDRGPGYRLDGPFTWPAEQGARTIHVRRARMASGSSPLAAPPQAVGAAGIPGGADPLCEADASGDWQCVGIARDFSGRVVTCREGAITGAAEVHPGSPSDVSIRPVSVAALLRADLPGADAATPVSVRVLRPRAPGDFAARQDPRWTVTRVDGNHVWIETEAESAHGTVEVSAAGHVARRFPLNAAESRCADPVAVTLTRAAVLEGIVADPGGAPVDAALVLVRSVAPGEEGAVVGEAQTDANGKFEVPGLEPVAHRVRACHGEHGCSDGPAVPGSPIVLRLSGRGAFIGRALSSGGVPETEAVVRILPTAESWTASKDRLERLPLDSRTGADGRFRISAAENGDYLVEVRGESSGVARVAVRRSSLSPAVTDLGDVRLPEAIEFTARVRDCNAGYLLLSGPLGGETSLPSVSRFRLADGGLAAVRLPEGGVWTAWASCGGSTVWIEPALLPDAASLAGREVIFERAPGEPGSGNP